jgi:prepilin-type N-terminal cleavage/methylation domain-containing protein
MSDQVTATSESGFTLIEVLVALIVISMVGLMAWRGMDAMMRGQENIESRAKQDAVYMQLIRQFERDCQEIIPSTTLDIPSYSVGEKNIWWVRRYEQANQIHWVIVGYGISTNGLRRLVSQPLANKTQILRLWQPVIRDPDLISSNMKISLEIPEIIYQETNAITSATSQAAMSNQLAGFSMRWGIKNIPFPISRSCLAGTSL